MKEVNNLIELIYTFYPQNCRYSSNYYKKSIEHNKYIDVLKNSKRRRLLSEKCYEIIKSVFFENYITKWTNTEYPSIHFSALLHKNQPILDDDLELLNVLNGRRIDLEIYISLLGDYFYTYIVETRKSLLNDDLQFNYYDEKEFLESSQINNLNNKLFSIGFTKLDKSIVSINVPNIETELLYEGEVKIFNALFSDVNRNF
ncbi:MAG TPA: hypothetical protein VIO64_16220 [Pseudobacteroides sp.]|uniref:hypothetical protein n=1 Tax=Pseudobacteroides sp. TaxID=1968840 RepID=UPI002F94D0BE